MQFHKIRHPDNFRFAPEVTVQARVRDLGSDVFHLELDDPARWSLDARKA